MTDNQSTPSVSSTTASTTPASQSPIGQQISMPALKFLIGFTAGICAACFPRLTASLAVSGGDTEIVMFSTGYILISLAFACLVGLVVMIMEWRVAREPRATFMMAIGLPALITGSLNTTTGITAAKDQASENQELVRQLEEFADIQTIQADEFTPLSFNEMPESYPQRHDASFAWTDMIGVKAAYAGPLIIAKDTYNFNPNIKIKEPKYYVIIDEFSTKAPAIQRAETLKSVHKNVTAVKSGSRYLILYSKRPTSRSDALLISIKLKKKLKIKPRLMKAK